MTHFLQQGSSQTWHPRSCGTDPAQHQDTLQQEDGLAPNRHLVLVYMHLAHTWD